MRMKFEKGMTPERIAQAFVEYVRQNNMIIGAVNMYVQTYDGNMKAEKFDSEDCITCSPFNDLKNEYDNDVAVLRRKRLRAV